MKTCLVLFIFFFIISCASTKSVYWCGDHPCINKKEKEAYFKKTMIVEIRDLNKNNYKDESNIIRYFISIYNNLLRFFIVLFHEESSLLWLV